MDVGLVMLHFWTLSIVWDS